MCAWIQQEHLPIIHNTHLLIQLTQNGTKATDFMQRVVNKDTKKGGSSTTALQLYPSTLCKLKSLCLFRSLSF